MTLFSVALLPRKFYRIKMVRSPTIFLCGLAMLMSMAVIGRDAYPIYSWFIGPSENVVSYIIHCIGFFVFFSMACEAKSCQWG